MRVEAKGIIDRSRELRFRFNGRQYMGFAGDTLASALLANGVKEVARSFKYHRPRGVLTAGSEEPNALVEVIGKVNSTPNVRATMQEIFEGLETRSQNHLGPLSHDLMAINDYLHPLFGAGFYYKTFKWPRKAWDKLYEPLIRKAAGLGRLSGKPDEGSYEKAWAHCDVLVIGSGPSGLMAALMAARSGADVILAEESAALGGRFLAENQQIDGVPATQWLDNVVAELRSLGVQIMTRTTVTGAYDGGTYSAIERVGLHRPARADLPRECFWRIVAGRTILAAGALERMVAFPNNDRPGVMLASGVQTYLNRYGVAAGQRVTLFAADDHARQVARDLMAAGVQVAAIIDPRSDASSLEDCPVHLGAEVINTFGRHGLTDITVRKSGEEFQIETDCLAVAGGWNPALHLTCHMGARPRWSDDLNAFVPMEGAVPGLLAVGAANGSYSTYGALSTGQVAAKQALSDLGFTPVDFALPECEDAPRTAKAIWQVEAPGRSWLDFANDVTASDVKLAARENYQSVEHMKRYTTLGMAPDQGKTAGVTALAVLADVTGRDIAATGVTTYRPPYTPMSIAAVGAGGRGQGFAPVRKMPSHPAAEDRGAVMLDAGLWKRAAYFPKGDEHDWRTSCNREVEMVRKSVGVIDVTSLGKIEIFGPDAGLLLDLAYCNKMSSLAVGRVRYGLMLREDGHVKDDGTCARLGQNHWVITTTTAEAGPVLRHLDFLHQAFGAKWNMRITSATEAWAQYAISGPMARMLVDSMLDQPLGDFPHLSCLVRPLHGVDEMRIFRLSYTGEEGYEIAVPARLGEAVWRDLLARAETMGGGAFGVEALNILRLEKGFLTHAEIDGRTTADDLGYGKMVSAAKDCIGKVASQRPGLTSATRKQLVGLVSSSPFQGGAQVFEPSVEVSLETTMGHVTSAGYSPTLKAWIGLALVRSGRERIGSEMRVLDHLRKSDVTAKVVNPAFYDPEGGRMRG